MMEYWNIGILEYWNDGMLERGNNASCRLQVAGLQVIFMRLYFVRCSVFGVFETADLDCQIYLTEGRFGYIKSPVKCDIMVA